MICGLSITLKEISIDSLLPSKIPSQRLHADLVASHVQIRDDHYVGSGLCAVGLYASGEFRIALVALMPLKKLLLLLEVLGCGLSLMLPLSRCRAPVELSCYVSSTAIDINANQVS